MDTTPNNLYATLPKLAWQNHIERPAIPKYLSDNIRFEFFEWQKTALENLIIFNTLNKDKQLTHTTHLMFNMATGSGKTLLMASSILYYYKQGYRHFIFFVNQSNIVDKTENNFVNAYHNKYLFTKKVVIDDNAVNIIKVDRFSPNTDDIQIKFTSIQKLYNDIHILKENQTTLNDLHKLDLVMLADEAHHLNTLTTAKPSPVASGITAELEQMDGRTSKADVERKGWEHTVIELILNKNSQYANNRNVLLEFTATVPNNEAVINKYADKTLIKFGLKQFLAQGFTKEINLISTTLGKKRRILLALLFAWYRHKIALKYNIANFKPVMLFRSKTIAESRQDYDQFLLWIGALQAEDLQFIEQVVNDASMAQRNKTDVNQQGDSRARQMVAFIKAQNISYISIANWIASNYQPHNVVITNSKSNSTKTEKTDENVEKLLNSLEDVNNHIKAIFTVDRLTEGWDVLNLYDIVRLYQGQNSGGSSKKTPDATTKEKQLIGRGVRYYPFEYGNKLPNKRKFDANPNHELRILEELFYHTYDEESRYISHLKDELKKDGYIRDDRQQVTFDLKPEFKKTDSYNTLMVWHNQRIPNPNRKKNNIESLKQNPLSYVYKVPSLLTHEQEVVFEQSKKANQRLKMKHVPKHTIRRKLNAIETHIFNKAVHIKAQKSGSLYQFNQLSQELPITDISELQHNYFSEFDLVFETDATTTYENIPNEHKLRALLNLLEIAEKHLQDYDAPYIGSKFTASKLADVFSKPKTKIVRQDKQPTDVSDKPWFVLDAFYATDEEKAVVNFIENNFGNLQQRFKDIFVLKNEEVLTLYDFKNGQSFQPDFLLFMTAKDHPNNSINSSHANTSIHYQLFIESKGNQFVGNDNTFTTGKQGWKQAFLSDITHRYAKDKITPETFKNHTLIGLPFFNPAHSEEFKDAFNNQLGLGKPS